MIYVKDVKRLFDYSPAHNDSGKDILARDLLIISSSSTLNFRFLTQLEFSTICSGELAPIQAEVTLSSLKTHDSAICASV